MLETLATLVGALNMRMPRMEERDLVEGPHEAAPHTDRPSTERRHMVSGGMMTVDPGGGTEGETPHPGWWPRLCSIPAFRRTVLYEDLHVMGAHGEVQVRYVMCRQRAADL